MEDRILQNRHILEGNFISCILSDLTLIDDYLNVDIKSEFKKEETKFYFMLAKAIRKIGGNIFDMASVIAFIEDKKAIKEKFESYGGFDAINELVNIANINNIESHYSEIVKSNILLNLHDKGFNIESHYEKLRAMTLQEVYAWYENMLNDIFVKVETKVKVENIGISDKDIVDFDSGNSMGLNVGRYLPRINYLMSGLPVSEFLYIAGFQNVGKSSWSFTSYLCGAAENGYKSMLISNEQGILNFKKLLLIHVLTKRLNYWKIPLKKLKSGHFTDDDKTHIKLAQKMIEEEYTPNMLFAETFDYNITTIRRLCKTAHAKGVEVFCYDTFKLDSDGDGQAYIKFINDSKDIFQELKKGKMAGVMTLQMSMSQKQRRVLDLDMLASAKGVSEVAAEVIMIRALAQDEYHGEKNELKAWNYMKNADGKYTQVKEEYITNKDHRYIVAFHTKTRNDVSGTQILLEYNGAFANFKEVAWCSCADVKIY